MSKLKSLRLNECHLLGLGISFILLFGRKLLTSPCLQVWAQLSASLKEEDNNVLKKKQSCSECKYVERQQISASEKSASFLFFLLICL